MTPDAVTLLQQNINKIVRLTCRDGEAIVAKITLVDPMDEEIVFDMVSTTDESKYEKFDREPAYLLPFSDILSVEALGEGH
jgi:small nuclear ribonucleoprotein (snRNP)-like protein